MSELSIIDYPTIAVSLLIERFKDSKEFQKLIDIIAVSTMDLQTTMFEIKDIFVLPIATGTELTIIGNVWDISRRLDIVETDDEYRAKIEVKTTLFVSGTISEIKKILHTFYNATYSLYETNYPAGFFIETDANILQIGLNEFTAAGVEGIFISRANGSSIATSLVTGTARAKRDAYGISSSVSTSPFVQGAMEALRPIDSQVDSVSVVSGAAIKPYKVSGSSNSVSDVSGDMILQLPPNIIAFSINSEDIEDWKKVDGNDVSLNLIDKYPRVAASQGSSGGSTVHSHSTLSGNSGTHITTGLNTISAPSMAAHAHSISHTHAANQNNEPEYLKVLPVTEGAKILTSMFLFYNGASAPSGWSEYSAANNKMFKGNATPQISPTGGSVNHSHPHSGSSGSGGTVNQNTSSIYLGSIPLVSAQSHTHTINHTHSGGNNYPEWIGLLPIVPDSDTPTIPSGVIAFFKGSSIPSGWSAYSAATGKWIQGKSAGSGSGGANTHNHSIGGSSGTFLGTRAGINAEASGGNGLSSRENHNHTISHTHNTVNNIPPYQELMLLKKD